jgi:hypothetical protein
MKTITNGVVVVLVAVWASVVIETDAAAQKRPVRCGIGHRIRILDLNILPDPIGRGQKLERLRAIVQLDGIEECDTLFELREEAGDDVVAQGVKKLLRPGKNHVEFRPAGPYRFRLHEHCFQVVATIAGTRRPLDAARRFCARETTRHGRGWSLR